MSANKDTMPLLVIEARGEIVKSNFDEFAAAVRGRLAEFNLNLRTDEEFDQAAEDIKRLKSAEDALKAAEESAFDDGDMARLKANLRTLKTEVSTARLTLSRQLDNMKATVKSNIIDGALAGIDCERSMREVFRPLIENAVKGLKSFDSMREKSRIAAQVANDRIGRNKRELDLFEKANGTTMTADRSRLEIGENAALAPELSRRLERAKAEAREKELREEIAMQAAEKKAMEDAAKKELETKQAAEQLKPTANPEPTTIDDLPWDGNGPEGKPMPEPVETISEEAEWKSFSAKVGAAFTDVRVSRSKLTHSANRSKAEAFGEACSEAWERITKGGAK